MPGLVPGIHVGPRDRTSENGSWPIRVDGRDKPGHDGRKNPPQFAGRSFAASASGGR